MTIALPRLDRSTAAERGLTIGDFLVPVSVAERVAPRVRHIALILLGVLVVTLCAWIYIPLQPVPFTGQTFGVLLVGGALGLRRGATSLALYLLIGTLGAPIFSEGKSGVDAVLGQTGGYIIGFVVAAAVVGRFAELGWDRHVGGALVSMAVGTVMIYAIGVPWLKYSLDLTWTQAVAGGLLPFLAWDLAKAAVAGALFPLGWWLIGRRPDDR